MAGKYLTLTTTVLAVAILATTAAQGQTSGISADVTAQAGNIILNDNFISDYDFNGSTTQVLDFRLAAGFAGNMFGQIDYGLETNRSSGDGGIFTQDLGLHLGATTGRMTYGAMVSQGSNSNDLSRFNTLAVEAESKIATGALSGQVGMVRSETGAQTATYGRIAYARNVTRRAKVTASLGFAHWAIDSNTTLRLSNFGLQAEYKINENASILLSYQAGKSGNSNLPGGWNTATVYIGFHLTLGGTPPTFGDYNPIYGIQHAKFNYWD